MVLITRNVDRPWQAVSTAAWSKLGGNTRELDVVMITRNLVRPWQAVSPVPEASLEKTGRESKLGWKHT